MSDCCENRLGSGGADELRVLTNSNEIERALLRATTGHQANNESFYVDGDSGRVSDTNVGNKKAGMRGKIKCWWTHEERKVLWECFMRSGGKRTGGYIKKVKALWDERGLSMREVPSLLSQLKCIEKGLLTVMERGEIEKKVRNETREMGGVGERPMVISKEEWDVLFGESDDEEEFHGFENLEVKKHVNETDEPEDVVESQSEVDFEINDDGVNHEEIEEVRGTAREMKVAVEKMVIFHGYSGLWDNRMGRDSRVESTRQKEGEQRSEGC